MYDIKNDPDNLSNLSFKKAKAYHKDFSDLLIAKGVSENKAKGIIFLLHMSLKGKIDGVMHKENTEWLRESLKVKQEPIMRDGMHIIFTPDEEVLKMIEDGEKIIRHGIARDKRLVNELVKIGLSDHKIGDVMCLSVEVVKDYKKATEESDWFF